MSKLYVFAIGGTGSRVLRSLTMLAAAGVDIQANEIVPVIIDPDVVPTNGDVVLARISEEYSTIKRMFICDGKVELIPDNPKYRTITKKIEDVEIVGKIINIYKPPKKKRKRIVC